MDQDLGLEDGVLEFWVGACLGLRMEIGGVTNRNCPWEFLGLQRRY